MIYRSSSTIQKFTLISEGVSDLHYINNKYLIEELIVVYKRNSKDITKSYDKSQHHLDAGFYLV